MSLSADSLALRRKRTATERAINNGDPLVARKKACEATKSNTALGGTVAAAAKPAPVSKNALNVSQHFFSQPFLILDHNRQPTSIAVLPSTWNVMVTMPVTVPPRLPPPNLYQQ